LRRVRWPSIFPGNAIGLSLMWAVARVAYRSNWCSLISTWPAANSICRWWAPFLKSTFNPLGSRRDCVSIRKGVSSYYWLLLGRTFFVSTGVSSRNCGYPSPNAPQSAQRNPVDCCRHLPHTICQRQLHRITFEPCPEIRGVHLHRFSHSKFSGAGSVQEPGWLKPGLRT
jgi:hypothetical protein